MLMLCLNDQLVLKSHPTLLNTFRQLSYLRMLVRMAVLFQRMAMLFRGKTLPQ